MFTVEQIVGLEWQQIVPQQTPQNLYRVHITWALDKFRIVVTDLASGHNLRVRHAKYQRTAVATANRLLCEYVKREPQLIVDNAPDSQHAFAGRINPRNFNFSPRFVALVGAVIGYDYGVRDGRGNHISSISITSDGFIIGACNAFLGSADDFARNLQDYLTVLSKDDKEQFTTLYAARVKDWRL